LLSFKPGTGSKKQIAMMGGHLSGSQVDPQVSDFSLTEDASLGSNAVTFSVRNKSTGGTQVKLLAKRDASDNGSGVTIGISDTGVPAYVVASGAGTTGSAEFVVTGHSICTVDGAGSINQYLVASATTAGRCHPVTTPSDGDWVVGQLTNAPANAGADGEYAALGFRWSAGSGVTIPAQEGFIFRQAGGALISDSSVYKAGIVIASSDLPLASATGRGAVQQVTCSPGQFVNKVDGTSTCAAPAPSSSAPIRFFQSVISASAGSSPATANGCRLSSIYLPAVEFNYIGFRVDTADTTTTATYSVGLIGSDPDQSTTTGNSRIAHSGAIPAATMSSTGNKEVLNAEGTVMTQAGWHTFAFCASATGAGVAAINTDTSSNHYSRWASLNQNATSTDGVLNATIALPTDSPTRTSRLLFWLVKK
jgi:hypothetical protein